MKIGSIDLGERPILLAPMEDITDVTFRLLCREQGADMVYTEFIPSDGLIRDAGKAIAKMHTYEEESPVAIQIYGHVPESMVFSAQQTECSQWWRRPGWLTMPPRLPAVMGPISLI